MLTIYLIELSLSINDSHANCEKYIHNKIIALIVLPLLISSLLSTGKSFFLSGKSSGLTLFYLFLTITLTIANNSIIA